MRYYLEIYSPDSADDVWVSFEADSPFGAIAVGDIINPGMWDGSQSPMRVLKAVAVEHILWDIQELKHKVMVFTTEVEGTRELRLEAVDGSHCAAGGVFPSPSDPPLADSK